MRSNELMVSIVVPIYNVEEYLSDCLRSLINQTYQQLEIICVDDASLDSSYEICKQFEALDSRIKVYQNYKNRGLGFTRNKGVEVTNGEFLFFVDSDDWLPDDAIEKQLNRIVKENSDICVGAVSTYNQITGDYSVSWKNVEDDFALKTYLNWSMFNKLYRSTFYKSNKIEQYEGIYEDAATWPVIMRMAPKVSLLKEVTYFYRRFTGKSIMDKWENALSTQGALKFMVSGFEKRNYSIHDGLLYDAAFALARASLGQVKNAVKEGKCQSEIYHNFKEEIEDCLSELFQDLGYGKIGIFGSSNLNRIFRNLVLEYEPHKLETPIYNFSSIISLASDSCYRDNISIFHEKTFRENMVKKDWLKLFWGNNNCGLKYLIMDFVDERYDIIEKDGFYYTRSEAFEETYIDEPIIPYAVIKRASEQYGDLWERQCKKFIERLNLCMPECKIILVELYLTDLYGTNEKKWKWKNQTYINNMNNILKQYYSIIKDLARNLIVISVEKEKMYTDEKFIYGCYPWHYNDNLYIELTSKVREIINN